MRSTIRFKCPHRSSRAGITKIEVAVILGVLIVVATVVIERIKFAQAAALRIRCSCHMKALTTATLNWASRNNGRLPDLYEESSASSHGRVRAPWTLSLLADLDSAQIRRAFDVDPNSISGISLKFFQCPADTNNFATKGGLSYVANTGYIREDIYTRQVEGWQFAHSPHAIDWKPDGTIDEVDIRIAVSTGCFWPPVPNDDGPLMPWKRMDLDFIASGDGQADTILFVENIQARNWHRADAIPDFAFGVPVVPAEDLESEEHARLNCKPIFLQRLKTLNALPGTALQAKPGTAPRPSTNHGGTCIYGFADGSAKHISDAIDWDVYLRLLTPNGQRYGQKTLFLDSY